MAYDLIKISALPAATPDESQEIVVGVGDLAKRINYGDVKNDMVGTSPSYTTDTEPYLMRQTAHVGVVGKCALEKLVGGSLGWNQIIPHTASTGTSNGITFTNNNDGSWTLTGTGASANAFVNLNYVNSTTNCFVPNHIYYATVNKSGSTILSTIGMLLSGAASDGIYVYGTRIFKAASTLDARGWARLQVTNATNIDIGTVKLWPQIFDLTQMFGDTIADYIYQLENSSSGSGIAWLRKYIDIDSYHAYDAGSIQNVQATAHVMKDANDNVIGNYALGSDTLRGFPQLISNKLQFDGDEKYPDGTIKRKYGIVNLGSLQWTYNSAPATPIFSTSLTDLPTAGKSSSSFMVCPKYKAKYNFWNTAGNDKCVASGSANLNISDSDYTNAAAFKSAMSSVYLVYELVTESTESSTAYQKVQTIDADGTESFTTSTPVPVGHETQTPDNILAALGWLGE